MKQRNRSVGPACEHADHPPPLDYPPAAVERAARLFRAMGDHQRLAVLLFLANGERCVSEVVTALGEKFPTVSQRLRILHTEGLVRRRRVGLHVHYALADAHVADLVANALAHAAELPDRTPNPRRDP